MPFTSLAPGVVEALDATGWSYETVAVSGSDEAYYDLLSGLWADSEGWINVEHDVLVNPDTLDELADCPHDWCRFPVEYVNGPYPGLGCVKFSTEIVRRNPDAMVEVGLLSDGNHPRKFWCRLDGWLQSVVLPRAAENSHIHETVLAHVRDYDGQPQPSHGCLVT